MVESRPIVLFTGVQRFARQLPNLGYVSACLKEPDERFSSSEHVDYLIPYDPRDLSGLESWAREWPQRHRVVGVINRRERRVMEHAVLNRALNRPGIDIEQAQTLRDKVRFRGALGATVPHLNPPFQPVDLDSPDPPKVPYPFVLKPPNLFKSQLISLCRRPEDWTRTRMDVAARREGAAERHGVEVKGPFLAEAYLQGKEASLDVLVTREGRAIPTPAVELTPARDWDMEDFHVAVRHLPAALSALEEERIRAAAKEAIEALRLRATPVHVDLVLANGEPIILEMAPRIGGYRSEMMDLAHGCPLDPLNLDLALERLPRWNARWHRAVAVAELFPSRPGRLVEIHGLDRVRTLPSFRRLRQRIPLGEPVGWASDGFRCPLFVILHHEDPGIVRQDVGHLRELVHISVGPMK